MKPSKPLAVLLAAFFLIPAVLAAPEIAPATDPRNDVFVDGATDYFEFAPGTMLTVGSWSLTSPDGSSISFVQNSMSPTGPVSFYLDGSLKSGSGWISSGNIDGASVNGTWTIRTQAGYNSNDFQGGANSPGPTLYLNGKSAHFGTSTINPQTWLQTWNWHETVTSWVEASTIPGDPSLVVDPIDEADDEDPDLARYFAGPGTPQGIGNTPIALTGGFTVNCGALTASVDGAWFRGATQSGPTHAFFTYVNNFQVAATDLTTVPGSATTSNTNKGSGTNGTHTATIPYSNLLGTSYQFSARAGSSGSAQDGLAFYIPSNLCDTTIPNLSGLDRNQNDFQVKVSQGQCSIDNTTINFMVDQNLMSADIYITNAETGLVVQSYDESMFFTGPAQMNWFGSFYIPPGDWVAIGIADIQGALSPDKFDSVPFNVKEASCKDEPVTIDIGNITIELTDALILQLINETTEHRHNSLELNGLDFETLGFDGFLIMLSLAAVFAFAVWHGYTFLVLVSGLGIASRFIPGQPLDYTAVVFLILIAFFLEYFIGGFSGLRKRFRRDHDEDDSNPW